MQRYIVQKKEVWFIYFSIEAENEKEAKELVLSGKGHEFDQVESKTDPAFWNVFPEYEGE
jgi:hypothetical protein